MAEKADSELTLSAPAKPVLPKKSEGSLFSECKFFSSRRTRRRCGWKASRLQLALFSMLFPNSTLQIICGYAG